MSNWWLFGKDNVVYRWRGKCVWEGVSEGRDAIRESRCPSLPSPNIFNSPKRPPEKLTKMAKGKKKRKRNTSCLSANREERFPNSVSFNGLFCKFYQLQTYRRVQRPLVFFKPFEKQVKLRVAHTPKGKNKERILFTILKKGIWKKKLNRIS